MPDLIDNLQEALDNINNFQKIKDARYRKRGIPAFDSFGKFKAWFYNPDTKKFGPSKFIGYKNTTIKNYTGADYGNGGRTNKQLKMFFNKVDTEDQNYSNLMSELDDFVRNKVGKKLSKKFESDKNGGIYIPKELTTQSTDDSHPDEVSDQDTYIEGAVTKVTVNRYERDPSARQQCINSSDPKYTCKACNLNFGTKYGVKGNNFIHVHHIKLLSEIPEDYKIVPEKDLIQLCPNCHAMVHKGMTVNEIRKIFNLPEISC